MDLLIAEECKFVKDLACVQSLFNALELPDCRLEVFAQDVIGLRKTGLGKVMSLCLLAKALMSKAKSTYEASQKPR